MGFFGGSWWRTSDVVYDKRAVEIPLSDSLRTYIEHALTAVPSDSIAIKKNGQEVASSRPRINKLPDKLLYVNWWGYPLDVNRDVGLSTLNFQLSPGKFRVSYFEFRVSIFDFPFSIPLPRRRVPERPAKLQRLRGDVRWPG